MALDCPAFGIYSFRNVAFSIDGRLVYGFDESEDCINIEPTTDEGTAKVGADGTSMVSLTADMSAKVTIKLLPVSPFNAWLEGRRQRQRGIVAAVGMPIGFTDLASRESGGCTQATIIKRPNIQRGPGIDVREWVFFCPCWTIGAVDVVAAA